MCRRGNGGGARLSAWRHPATDPCPRSPGPRSAVPQPPREFKDDERRLRTIWTGWTAPVAIYDAGLPGMKAVHLGDNCCGGWRRLQRLRHPSSFTATSTTATCRWVDGLPSGCIGSIRVERRATESWQSDGRVDRRARCGKRQQLGGKVNFIDISKRRSSWSRTFEDTSPMLAGTVCPHDSFDCPPPHANWRHHKSALLMCTRSLFVCVCVCVCGYLLECFIRIT